MASSLNFYIPAAKVSEDLTDFPVMLDLSLLPATGFWDTTTNGTDLVVKSGATTLSRELVNYNKAGKTGQLWFKTNLSDSAANVFTLEFGTGSSGSNSTAVWSNGYKGVWHTNQDPQTGGACILDSSGNNNHGTPVGTMLTADLVAGKVGKALDFDGTDDYINIPDHATLDIADAITFGAWIKCAIPFSTLRAILSKHFLAYEIFGQPTAVEVLAYLGQGGEPRGLGVTGTNIQNNTWAYIQVTYDKTTYNVYIDAVVRATTTAYTAAIDTNNSALQIGARQGNYPFIGLINEVRVSNTARSAGWVATEYANQNGAATFTALGLPIVLTSVTPSTGPNDGTQVIDIVGTGFQANATVKVGTTDCTGVGVASATLIHATVPAGITSGLYGVTVTNTDTGTATKANAYTVPTLIVTGITPNDGYKDEATAVTIHGTDFVATPTITVGGVSCTSVVFVNATTLTAIVPAKSISGAYDVVVTNPDAQISTLAGGFTVSSPVIRKRVLSKHSFEIRHITNPYIAGGAVVTRNIPFIEASITKELMKISEAEISFPNTWVNADGNQVLTRNLFNRFDIIEVWRDKELDFSGLILKISRSMTTIALTIVSHLWLLTQAYTRTQSYTEEPSVTVKRLLKRWYYAFYDDFVEFAPGDTWTVISGSASIVSEAMQLSALAGVAPAIKTTDSIADWIGNTYVRLDLKSSVAAGAPILRPNAAGDESGMSVFPVGSTNYDNVNEAVSDGDATYNYGWNSDLYNFEATGLLPGTQVSSISLHTLVQADSPYYYHEFWFTIKTGGRTFNQLGPSGYEAYLVDSPAYVEVTHTLTVNPNTGQPWTAAEIDALQAGCYSAGGGRFTQYWITVNYQPSILLYAPYIDASNYILLDLSLLGTTRVTLSKVVAGVTLWSAPYSDPVPADSTIEIERRDNAIRVFIDGRMIIQQADSASLANTAGYFRVDSTRTTGVAALFDNAIIKRGYQAIAEGTLDAYPAVVTTDVAYEQQLNAILERICPQLESSDPLATTWEIQERFIPHDPANPTNPHSCLDFKSRIGRDTDQVLSIKNGNVGNPRVDSDFEKIKTSLIALGSGTSDVDGVGQLKYEASDYPAYQDIGMILTDLVQLSDEQDAARLATITELLLRQSIDYQDSIEVDPVDYEKKGFQVGDSYLIDVEEIGSDPDTPYRILSETRTYSPDGAEQVAINLELKTRSLTSELKREIRQLRNKARTDQGQYSTDFYRYKEESVAAAAKTVENKQVKFRSAIHKGVKFINWNVYCSDEACPWSIWVDGTDRTTAKFGAATVTGSRNNIDLTCYLTTIGDHTIEVKNNHASTAYTFASWGHCLLKTGR